jgi:hypothetical protein
LAALRRAERMRQPEPGLYSQIRRKDKTHD